MFSISLFRLAVNKPGLVRPGLWRFISVPYTAVGVQGGGNCPAREDYIYDVIINYSLDLGLFSANRPYCPPLVKKSCIRPWFIFLVQCMLCR